MEAGSSPGPVPARREDETDLLAQLRYFETRVDKEDPEQNSMLEQIREHVRRLRQGRGEWDRPSTDRSWNDPTLPLSAKAPMAVDSYRAYKKHIANEHGAGQGTPLLRQGSA